MNTKESKDIIKKRGSIVEHPFGTIKRTLGWDHFLVRGKNKVAGENALIMFTYNFKRLLNLLGITLFKKLISMGRSNCPQAGIVNLTALRMIVAKSGHENTTKFIQRLSISRSSTDLQYQYQKISLTRLEGSITTRPALQRVKASDSQLRGSSVW